MFFLSRISTKVHNFEEKNQICFLRFNACQAYFSSGLNTRVYIQSSIVLLCQLTKHIYKIL